MSFEEKLNRNLTLLRNRGKVSRRTRKRELDVDDTVLDDIVAELCFPACF